MLHDVTQVIHDATQVLHDATQVIHDAKQVLQNATYFEISFTHPSIVLPLGTQVLYNGAQCYLRDT